MPKRKLEKNIERKCVEYAASCGWMHIKLDRAKRGWPDQLFLGPNRRVFLVEFKRPGEVARPHQLSVHRQLSAVGFDVAILDSFEAFCHWFDRLVAI